MLGPDVSGSQPGHRHRAATQINLSGCFAEGKKIGENGRKDTEADESRSHEEGARVPRWKWPLAILEWISHERVC